MKNWYWSYRQLEQEGANTKAKLDGTIAGLRLRIRNYKRTTEFVGKNYVQCVAPLGSDSELIEVVWPICIKCKGTRPFYFHNLISCWQCGYIWGPSARLAVELDDLWLKLVELAQNAERLNRAKVTQLLREGKEKVDLALTALFEEE